MAEGQALLAALRPLLPQGAALAWADPLQAYEIMPGEALKGAVDKRLREFSAGRRAARQALAALGLPAQAIPQGPNRAPIWPVGVTGSITHSKKDCLAVIWPQGARPCTRGIGIDLEAAEPLEPALWSMILRPSELHRLAATPEPGREAKAIFAIKEAAYKAQFARSQKLFGFEGLEVSCDSGQFSARFCLEAAPYHRGELLRGHYLWVEDQVVALCHT